MYYSKAVRVIHWSMAGGIIGCFGLVTAAQQTEDKKRKGQLMRLHKSFGLLMLGALGARIGARLLSRAPPPLPAHKAQHFAANASHAALYGMMVFMPASGVVMGYYGGAGLPFFGLKIPAAPKEQRDKALAKDAWVWHKRVGTVFEYAVPLHIGGAAVHALKGQKIFARMNPFL